MRPKGFILFLLLLGTFAFAKAQYNPLDTFRVYLKKKPDLYFSLDWRNSFVRSNPAIIDGFRFGLSYGSKIRLLAGIYDLRYPITRTYQFRQGTPEEETRYQRSDFFYLGLTCDYVLYRTKKWKLALPVQTGFGWGNRTETNTLGEVREDIDTHFVPFEVSFSASYNILPWLYASAGLGYRYALFSNRVSADFSAPIYTYGVGIDVQWIWENYLQERVLR